ncbi:MAG: PTS sugar transporter subunit IIA, partial [Erysipelotrichaceae bacterium]|nr:PTS sugar transporter subunit IIA [Erysipelotrichaceae bacterium]
STTILNKLLLNFSNQIKIIGSFTSEEEFRENKDSLEKHKHVMIFTVIPLKDEFIYKDEYGYDIVNMTSFNLESQYNMLQRRISNHQDAYSNYKLRNNFHFYFEEDLFFINDHLSDKSQILSLLCDKMRLKNYIDDDFEANVYKRESAATTAFGNIAIPHSMEMDAVKTCVAVAISKEGIKWDNSVVNIVFLLSINKADKRSFRYLYESLIAMFSEQDFVQEVKKCTSFRDFEQLVFTNLQENDF